MLSRILISFALVLLLVSTPASAQTVTRKATLVWTAPTTCKGGGAITNCPVRGYSVQKLVDNVWTQIGVTTATVLTYTDNNIALGTHTYRVLAISDAGPSDPSNEVSKTLDVPGAPGGVVITVTVTVS